MNEPHYTEKVIKLIRHAEVCSKQHRHDCIESMDLFLGAILVNDGVLKEMLEMTEPHMKQIEKVAADMSPEHAEKQTRMPFSLPLSKISGEIWDTSLSIMGRYNQIFLNEGHIIKAFYQHLGNSVQLREKLKGIPHERILRSVTMPRDLTVDLHKCDWTVEAASDVLIVRVLKSEQGPFLSWMKECLVPNDGASL
ncbi:hypothetical protein [Bacillus sp. KH172YL63]|uniref:hypothetical protein n=1 Tax=Bacillus sp. KH172YL63 TaxID=2709784 RepID=UPI0013E46606|nr:hypothetical protein [Bacillus sp. KH172YL63]BCB04371.1 hypothetical protein KH172YL63_25040 [Bacillus sp. KH172YL63]